MKLLLHTCCAPCSVQCVEALEAEGIKPDLFWYNPNIHPFTEYRSRRDSLVCFAREKGLSLTLEDEYGLRLFIRGVSVIERSQNTEKKSGPRCGFCYRLRLERTARMAKEKGFDAFSSTLLISPYQNHGLIKQVGEELAAAFGVEFLYRDLRPRFRQGQNQARGAGYYIQKYCGCIYSEEERFASGESFVSKGSGP